MEPDKPQQYSLEHDAEKTHVVVALTPWYRDSWRMDNDP